LDDVVHQRVRLGILSILAQTREADFTYLRDTLGVTDGNLGRHLEVLNDAGYVALNKTFQGRRPRTWVTITPSGRRALNQQIATLRALIDTIDVPPIPPATPVNGMPHGSSPV
jgi:DNA-binding MarR family transcriptional regulator